MWGWFNGYLERQSRTSSWCTGAIRALDSLKGSRVVKGAWRLKDNEKIEDKGWALLCPYLSQLSQIPVPGKLTELWLTERQYYLSTFPSFKHPLIWLPSPHHYSPLTLSWTLLSGIQSCLTELERCPCQIKHFYQEQIMPILLRFQLWVFVLLTTSRPPRFATVSVPKWQRLYNNLLMYSITILAAYSFSQCLFSLADYHPKPTMGWLEWRKWLDGVGPPCVCFCTQYSLTTP